MDGAANGGDRFQAFGIVEGRVICVVFTRREAACRIISARIANCEERSAFQASLGEAG